MSDTADQLLFKLDDEDFDTVLQYLVEDHHGDQKLQKLMKSETVFGKNFNLTPNRYPYGIS